MADSAAKARGMLQRRENLPPSSSHNKNFFLSIYHNVVFWRNGFTLNEGPLRRFDNPENAAFLDSIRKSECPKELEQPANGRCYVHLNLFRRDQNSPVFLEELEKRQPFQGVGRTLGSATTTEVDLLEAGPIPPAQDVERKDCMKDRICGLPDEILIAILSLLTLKEAACTSVLSRRWRYLWRYITGRFNFDLKTLRAPSADGTSLEDPTKYVSWVNEVLKLHLGTFIDEMRISFCFRGHFPRDINDWIKFAMEKGVQRFELDVLADVLPTLWCQCYDFPSMENFKFLFGTSNSRHVSRTIGSAAGFCSLTTLRLVGVNIMEEVLGNLLSICPFLEQLCIVASKCLVNLKIAGPSLRLKCLEISYCHSLENLEISAINLVSFTSVGRDISVSFKNVPLLSELSIGGEFCSSFVFGSCKHSSYIPQIEKLKLDVLYEDLYRFPKYFRELGNLKQVELFVIGHAGDSLLSLTSVIKASPNLSKFSVQLFLGANSREVARGDRRAYIDAEKEATKCHHQCLKVVELVGFVGRSNSEIDLVLHILEIAPSLEKIIINPRDIYFKNPLQSRKTFEAERERAWRLKPILPATIELVVL